MTNHIKLAIGSLLCGGIAIGGTTYYLLNQNKVTNEAPSNKKKIETKTKKAISLWLSEDKKEMLEDGATEWKARWESFKLAYPNNKKPKELWGFAHWAASFAKDEAELKAKCIELAKSEIDSKTGEIYEEVKTYCTKDKEQRSG